jgi:hypothetical protein
MVARDKKGFLLNQKRGFLRTRETEMEVQGGRKSCLNSSTEQTSEQCFDSMKMIKSNLSVRFWSGRQMGAKMTIVVLNK